MRSVNRHRHFCLSKANKFIVHNIYYTVITDFNLYDYMDKNQAWYNGTVFVYGLATWQIALYALSAVLMAFVVIKGIHCYLHIKKNKE